MRARLGQETALAKLKWNACHSLGLFLGNVQLQRLCPGLNTAVYCPAPLPSASGVLGWAVNQRQSAAAPIDRSVVQQCLSHTVALKAAVGTC